MIYIKEFPTLSAANTAGAAGLDSPHIDYVAEKSAVNIYKATNDTFTCTFDENGKIVIPTPTQPNDEIWYTSSDGNIVNISNLSSVGAGTYSGPELLSNTYTDGKGIMKFASDVTWIGTQGVEDNFTYGINFVLAVGYGLENHLTSISLPSSVTEIRSGTKTVMGYELCFGAFSEIVSDSSELESITLSDSLTSIGKDTFNGCIRLTGITIPDSVTSIDDYAFSYCSSLNSITSNATIAPTLGSNVFINLPAQGTLTYPSGSDYSTWFAQLPQGWQH